MDTHYQFGDLVSRDKEVTKPGPFLVRKDVGDRAVVEPPGAKVARDLFQLIVFRLWISS